MEAKNLVKRDASLDEYLLSEPIATYADALRAAVSRIGARREAWQKAGRSPLDRKAVLFVPDKYTFASERLVCAGTGTFDTEVLTLNRLCFRLADYEGKPQEGRPLGRLGAVLTVRRILSENVASLRCYARSVRYPGFGETVYDNLCQFAAAGLHAEDLTYDSAHPSVLDRKLHDLHLVYEQYEQITRGKYVDAAGRLLYLDKLLAQGTDFFANTDVYFACFDDFTPLQRRIVSAVCGLSRAAGNEALVIRASCKPVFSADIEEYAAPSQADELKAAAVRIRDAARQGVRYGEMAVIAPAADINRLQRIFGEYDIPFFTDRKYSLSSHPLARYVLDLFAAADTGTNEAYVRLSKNPYTGLERKDADLFENYINYCALCEGAMRVPFAIEPSAEEMQGSLAVAERVRRRLTDLTAAVRRREIASGRDFCRAVETAFPHDEATISAGVDSPIPDAREKIAEAVEVLGEVFDGPAKFSDLTAALEESFALCNVSVLPNRSDTVTVGEVPVFRVGKYRYLCVLGFHEGEIPAVMRDDGLLGDRELDALKTRGITVEPKVETRNARAEAELLSVLGSAEKLFLSYRTDSAPSPLVRRLIGATSGRVLHGGKDAERSELAQIGERLRAGCAQTADRAALLRACPTQAAARELYLIGRGEKDAGLSGFGFEPELHAVAAVQPICARIPVVPAARKLYSARGISVSRVQEYFACPLRCFLRHGLRLTPRPDGSVSVLDVGTFLHRVIELYIRECSERGEYGASPERVRALIAKILSDDPQILRGVSEGFLHELTEEAATVSGVVAEQIADGEFLPLYFEKGFGFPQAEWEGLPVEVGDMRLSLNGYIDRLDSTRNKAARIIDYKTGYVDFSLADVYYGRKVQLAVYLKVAAHNGFAPAGMFYFPFSAGFAQDAASYRLQGIFDEQYAYEMDRGLASPEHVSRVVKAVSAKKSSPEAVALNRRCSGGAVTGEELRAVCDYAEAVFRVGAEEMLSGYCESVPLRVGSFGECTYCEMRAVCAALGGKKYDRIRRSVRKEFFAECMQKEVRT